MTAHVNEGVVREPPPPCSAVVGVVGSKRGIGLASDISLLQIEATTHALHQALGGHMSQAPAMKRLPTTIKFWLPGQVVRWAMPQMCTDVHGGGAGTTSASRKRKAKEVRYTIQYNSYLTELHNLPDC